MPFYTPSNDPEHHIDYDKFKPVYTYFHTDIEGKIRPLQFTYESEDNTRVTLKIDEIKYTKDINGGFMYRCLVTNYGRKQEVDLVYYVKEHVWVIQK